MLHRLLLPLTILVAAVTAGCGSSPGPKPDDSTPPPPPPELDAPWTGDGFTIQPPADWQVSPSGSDWVVRPARSHASMREALAKVVISWIELPPDGPRIESPTALGDVCEKLIRDTGRDLKLLRRVEQMQDARMIVTLEVLLDSEQGKSRHTIVSVLDPGWGGRAFWRVSASCWSGWWEYASPHLLRSVGSVRFNAPPTNELDVPPSMRDE